MDPASVVVGIGHSLGGNTMFILQHPEPIIPFSSFIMVEPMISPAWSATSQKFTTIDTGERGL